MTGRRLAALCGLAFVVAGCTAGSTGLAPASPTTGTPTPVVSASPSVGPTTGTAWGAIRDVPPASFPRYPGASDAPGATKDPVTEAISTSATLVAVNGWYSAALSAAGYKQTSVSNPAEDGSVVAEFDGGSIAPGCRAQLTYQPLGDRTFVFVLVAAACPSN